jgi:hypothetical protein
MNDISSFLQLKSPKLPLISPGTLNLAKLNPIPRRYRASRNRHQKKRTTSNFPPWATDASALKTSFNPLEGVRQLSKRKWRLLDIQYAFLAFLGIFSLAISPSAPLVKSLAVSATVLVLLMPVSRQFFLPSLSIWIYLLYFFCSR